MKLLDLIWSVIRGRPASIDAVGALTPAADRVPYFTSGTEAALATFTAFARQFCADGTLTGPITGTDGRIEQRNGILGQRLFIAKTWTSVANHEMLVIDAAATSGTTPVYRIGNSPGSAGGSQRAIQIGAYNAAGTWLTAMQIEGTGAVGDMNFGGGSQLTFSGSGALRWLANGVLRVTNAASTVGAAIDVTTDNQLCVRNRANNADANLKCLAILPGTLANSAAPNNSIYFSSDASRLVFKDASGIVNSLY
jgi:hypothetical protein